MFFYSSIRGDTVQRKVSFQTSLGPLMKLYRYLTNGEGVWSAGKRLLPVELVEEVNKKRARLTKPLLPEGGYRFWLTKAGKIRYGKTLFITHQKYLPDIKIEEIFKKDLGRVVYEDEFQVVESLD